ncbi:MAG: patatin-like phospholipase family protein [Bacteroidota bacterium]
MSKSIAISLSGGAIRGVAHIGVLQAFHDNDIYPDVISGASMGSLIGVLYAQGYRPKEILEVFDDASVLKLFRLSIPVVGLTDLSYIEKKLKDLLPTDDFAALKKPFYVSVTNLSQGRFEIINSGSAIQAVIASSSIPILFKAQRVGEELYVDGGLLNNLPIEPLQKDNHILIGVNVTPIKPQEDVNNLLEIAYRTLDLIMWSNVESRLAQCDVQIEPGADDFRFFDLKKVDAIYRKGYEAGIGAIPQIQRLLGKKIEVISKIEGIEPVEIQEEPLTWWQNIWRTLLSWLGLRD